MIRIIYYLQRVFGVFVGFLYIFLRCAYVRRLVFGFDFFGSKIVELGLFSLKFG